MSKIRQMMYTKDNGDISKRTVMVISEPRTNYLCYDLTGLSLEEIDFLEQYIKEAELYREDCLMDFEKETGIQVSKLWRSFKPTGIDWKE